MRIHVVAVSGTGMGPLAGLLRSLGHDVSGSDQRFDPPIGPKLVEWGIRCVPGFSADNLKDRPDLVVVGNLCRSDNPEARYALDSGLDTTHIGGALQRFVLPGTRPLVVAGTHGKTTTSALATALLTGAGRKPGYLIGGVPKSTGRSFERPQPSAGAPFVIEGDEYDTAFFDKTAKFLHYQAEVLVLTSLEHDHIDIYPTIEAYRRPFAALVEQVPEHGCIVANAEDPELRKLLGRGTKAPIVWYGMSAASAAPPAGAAQPPVTLGASIDKITQEPGVTEFALTLRGGEEARFRMDLPGRHNVANAAAAIAAVHFGYGVPLAALTEPLRLFEGVARRQDLIGTPRGISVYDDFAHHPTAVRETLLALRSRHPGARLFAVFEPRSATACRSLHQGDYPAALGLADFVLLAPVARSLAPDERLDTLAVAAAIRAQGGAAEAFPLPPAGGRLAGSADSVEQIIEWLAARARPGDVIAVLSNGSFGGLHARLLQALAA